MTQCKFADTPLRDSVVDGTAPHFRAERTGIVLISDIEYNLLDIRLQTGVGDAELIAEFLYRRKVHAFKSELDGNGFQLKMFRIIFAEVIKGNKQQHAVLSTGYTDGDSVAFCNHTVIINGTPNCAGKFIQCVVHGILR